uniref:Uncharacterized protein n=1 Tax=viral metagenome TaxID=1070528 RepID=A0A6C0JZY2_9ZZZZ
MSLYQPPYYISLDSASMPHTDDKNCISNLGGYCIHYYCLYFAKSSFSDELYVQYEHNLEKWITHHYKDNSTVQCNVELPSYQRNAVTISCTKYTFETPYNILKLHIESAEDDPLVVNVCASISIKMPENPEAQTEKNDLKEYLENIRNIVLETTRELNNTYYDELSYDCDIEYP